MFIYYIFIIYHFNIIKDAKNSNFLRPIQSWCSRLCSHAGLSRQSSRQSSMTVTSINRAVLYSESNVTFTEYEPYYFRKVRHAYKVDDVTYVK